MDCLIKNIYNVFLEKYPQKSFVAIAEVLKLAIVSAFCCSFLKFIFILFIYVFCLLVCLCTKCIPGARGSKTMACDP